MNLIINIDGGSRGNPGPAAAGVVIRDAEKQTLVHQAGLCIGRATNNIAEYAGLLAGLKKAVELHATKVEVLSDSELLVRQMLGEYRVKNEGLKPMFQEACALARKFDAFAIRHVRREDNRLADKMVNLALDAGCNVGDK